MTIYLLASWLEKKIQPEETQGMLNLKTDLCGNHVNQCQYDLGLSK